MTKSIDELRCHRGTHVLATLAGDEDGLVVEVHEALAFTDGIETNLRNYRARDLGAFAAQGVTAACSCGQRYTVDLIPPLTTRRFAPLLHLKDVKSSKMPTGGALSKRRRGVR